MTEEAHEARAAKLLDEKVCEALDYIAQEFTVTNAAMIGVLMCRAHALMHDEEDE